MFILRQPVIWVAVLLLSGSALHAQNHEILGEYKIGIVGRDYYEGAIYQAAHLGAKDAALELSQKYSIDVELLVATPTLAQGGSQPESLAELFIDAADGFIISPSAKTVMALTVQFAQEQEQEVVYFESALPGTEPLAAIIADEFAAGQMAAKAILKELPTQGRVGILTSNAPSPQLEDRLRGARAVLGFRRIQATVQTAPDYRSAIQALEQAVKNDRNDQITGWIFLEDWPPGFLRFLGSQTGRLLWRSNHLRPHSSTVSVVIWTQLSCTLTTNGATTGFRF